MLEVLFGKSKLYYFISRLLILDVLHSAATFCYDSIMFEVTLPMLLYRLDLV